MRYNSKAAKETIAAQIAAVLGFDGIPDNLWALVFGGMDNDDPISHYLEDIKLRDSGEAKANYINAVEAIGDFFELKKKGVTSNLPVSSPQEIFSGQKIDFRLDFKERVNLTKDEEAWLDAVNECLTLEAMSSQEFSDFLSGYLPNGSLSRDMIYSFLNSPALRLFSLAQLQDWGIDILSHSCELVLKETSAILTKFVVRFLPTGDLRDVTHRTSSERDLNMNLAVPRGEQAMKEWTSVTAFPGTVLDDVRRLSVVLAEKYDWDARQVIDLLLRGQLLRYPPIPVRLRRRTVTMTLPYIISADTVARVFRDLQKEYFQRKHSPNEPSLKEINSDMHSFKKRNPPRLRLPSPRNVEMYIFVTRAIRAKGKEWTESPAQRKEIYENWNKSIDEDLIKNTSNALKKTIPKESIRATSQGIIKNVSEASIENIPEALVKNIPDALIKLISEGLKWKYKNQGHFMQDYKRTQTKVKDFLPPN